MTLQAGQIIEGKYRIVRVLGQGGMGAVYEGENVRIARRVAIKVLHASVANKADIVQRFEREAQAAGRIGSEHIVEVLDLGSLPSGERFMVMEFLDGEPLGDRIKGRGRLSALEAATILQQLLDGLAAAHNAGIVHRDLKPDNVFLLRSKAGHRDFVKLVDFGVSKFSAMDAEFSMTRTGAVMGTPFYMSPEQARGQQVDHRSDLYSVGVVAYQMVTGRVPFNADTFNELLFKIALDKPEPAELFAPGLDPSFSAIIMRGMAREMAHRFQSAGEFRAAIDAWLARSGHAVAPSHVQPMGPGGGGPLAQSGAGAWASASGSALQRAMGTSQPGMMATSQPGMGASQPGAQLGMGSSQPGVHPMNQSQVALAVTTGQPKRSGAVIAAVLGMAVLGVGGGFAAFKFVGNKASASGVEASTKSEPAKSDASPGEASKSDPAKSDPAKSDPAKSDPAKDPSSSDSAKAEPGKTDPGTSGSSKTPAEAKVADAKVEQGKAPQGTTTKPPSSKVTTTKDPVSKDPPKPPPQGGRAIDGSL
jgi:serine/threonine-protein kinase